MVSLVSMPDGGRGAHDQIWAKMHVQGWCEWCQGSFPLVRPTRMYMQLDQELNLHCVRDADLGVVVTTVDPP